jgi:glycogen(starch) synthase
MTGSIHLGIQNHFHFTGFLDRRNVHRLLSMTDVLCMPSISEPFGLCALEAAQFGIPAVISNQSGVSEILPRARKADPWNTSLMASHIVELTTNDEEYLHASQAAREDQKDVTWDRAASKLVDQYQKLLRSY